MCVCAAFFAFDCMAARNKHDTKICSQWTSLDLMRIKSYQRCMANKNQFNGNIFNVTRKSRKYEPHTHTQLIRNKFFSLDIKLKKKTTPTRKKIVRFLLLETANNQHWHQLYIWMEGEKAIWKHHIQTSIQMLLAFILFSIFFTFRHFHWRTDCCCCCYCHRTIVVVVVSRFK